MIAQSFTVWQIRLSDKEISVRELFFKGMSVGKDHVSSAMYTLVFVYASTGSAYHHFSLSVYEYVFLVFAVK